MYIYGLKDLIYIIANVYCSHHGGYQSHDQTQQIDPYSQSGYSAPTTAQQGYNGYGQSSGYTAHTTQASTPASSSYAAHHGTEYDQSQYQSYKYVFLLSLPLPRINIFVKSVFK